MGLIAQKAVLLLLMQHLTEIFFAFRLRPQDFCDTLASSVSGGLAMMAFILLMARMFLFKAIECMVPSEWSDPWEKAAEAYCYVDGAFAVPRVNLNKTGPEAWNGKVPLTYYYWVPIILIVLAMILRTPDLLWDMYCQRSDGQPGQTLASVAFLTELDDSDEAEAETQRRSGKLGDHLMSASPRDTFGGSRLFAAYLASKGLRLAACLGSVFFLQRSFGLPSPWFGLSLIPSLSAIDSDDQAVERFPTITFCDVPLRQLARWNLRTVQCVMPINLLLGKMLLFFWFWLVACSVFCVASAAVWLTRVGSWARRRRYVKTFVRVLFNCELRRRKWDRERRLGQEEREETLWSEPLMLPREKAQLATFEQSLIRRIGTADRVFILKLVQERLGLLHAYYAMETMTLHHCNELVKRPTHQCASDPECV